MEINLKLLRISIVWGLQEQQQISAHQEMHRHEENRDDNGSRHRATLQEAQDGNGSSTNTRDDDEPAEAICGGKRTNWIRGEDHEPTDEPGGFGVQREVSQ